MKYLALMINIVKIFTFPVFRSSPLLVARRGIKTGLAVTTTVTSAVEITD